MSLRLVPCSATFAIGRPGGYLAETHLAVRHQRRFPPPKVATVPSQTILAYVTVALAAAVVLATYLLGGVRVSRREAWELDRAEWRKWISRP
jgi:hypothetical protein